MLNNDDYWLQTTFPGSLQEIAINPDISDHTIVKMKSWENRPYIVTQSWSVIEAACEADIACLHIMYPGDYTFQREQIERGRRRARDNWFDIYPYGIRYEIKCVDGFLLDRPSVWGTEGTLKEAIARAYEGPAWVSRSNDNLLETN